MRHKFFIPYLQCLCSFLLFLKKLHLLHSTVSKIYFYKKVFFFQINEMQVVVPLSVPFIPFIFLCIFKKAGCCLLQVAMPSMLREAEMTDSLENRMDKLRKKWFFGFYPHPAPI